MFADIATVFWRDWVVLKRRIGVFIFSRMVTPLLYLVAFGWGLGRSIQVNHSNYLDFIVPGILALNSMNISFNSVGSPLNMSRLYYKTLEEYLLAPISAGAFVIGKILSGTLRGLLSSAIIVVLAYLFGANFILNGPFVLVLALNCMVFSSLGFIAAMIINSHEDMGNFSTYVLLPMSFLSATFFTTDKYPALVRWILDLLPLTHASYALRAIGAGGEAAGVSWAVLAAYCIIFFLLSVWLMNKVRE
ncbi:MAG TPA: ABC transporter permease [Methylomusa anaerophila]|uniref:Transport permease protein n=1 Tax=Methylomusa anaerophila TaxID=1930071 RepID=A0A348ALE2_9FIRM|nr:ABC transporter permease [Methylomusa anaerophila]BBB91890.1 inner membrane transport permease YadH [Methylomusa anaerophila]HML88379.1 ABC transporter permease [Methylomusa anaerophila]